MVASRPDPQPDLPNPPADCQYSESTAREVLRVAAALQGRQGGFTQAELEAVGSEVGLQPTAIRQALAQVVAAPPAELVRQRRKEFWALLAALAVAPLWASLAGFLWYLYREGWNVPAEGLAPLTLLFLPLLVAVVQGFIARRREAGFAAGMGLGLCLSCPFWWWVRFEGGLDQWPAWGAAGAYAVFGGLLGGGLGVLGGWMREYYFPASVSAPLMPGGAPLLGPDLPGSREAGMVLPPPASPPPGSQPGK